MKGADIIKTLNGKDFSRMFISGANLLYNNKQIVDELNVFPVPDGDTGTNMSLTAAAVAQELISKAPSTVTKAADIMQFAALRGARGNSGVILSQIFRGISKSLKGKDSCSAKELAQALEEGSKTAYKAVMKPTEGTILTVAREGAAGAMLENSDEIISIIRSAYARASTALAYTPKQLAALAQAGVVDAGGQGWVFILNGMLFYLENGEIVQKEGGSAAPSSSANISAGSAAEDIKFRYCTEFIIEKSAKEADADNFKNTISSKGDCMLVIDDDDIIKVHIHTNHPGEVLEEALKLGEMINIKIDNMKHQHKSIIDEAPKPAYSEAVTLQGDVKKAKQVKPDKEFGFAAVCAGKGFSKILKDLGIDIVIEGGQTMNPSTNDILKAVRKIKAKNIFVFPNNKNIIMAANQAAELCEDKNVIVIPSKNTPQCITAMMSFNIKKNVSDNETLMVKALDSVKTGQITFAVRDTEIEDVHIHKNDIIGIINGDIRVVGADVNDVLEELVNQIIDDDTEYLTVYTGKDLKKQQIEDAANHLSSYEDDEIEVSFKKGSQPLYYYIISAE